MKKVLIIGYLNQLTLLKMGSFRLLPLSKYLPQFDWQPIMLTAPLKQNHNLQARVVEVPCTNPLAFWVKLLKVKPGTDPREQVKERMGKPSSNRLMDFILTRTGEIVNYPDSQKNWRKPTFEAAGRIIENEHIDAIMSCHPRISHIIACALKEKYNIPWIADLPDLWSQNHNYYYSRLRRLLDRRLEVKTLARADAIVTISEPWADKLRTLHKGKSVYAITHGFDSDAVNIPPAELTNKFSITYTGSLYHGKHAPSKLFAALSDLISNDTIHQDDIEVRFYGSQVAWLDREIELYGLSKIVKQYGLVPHNIALEKQRESHLLLRLKWEDPREHGAYSSKIFEYLAARRPILATGGSDDVVSELLDETEAGLCASTVVDIKNVLKELYGEYKLKGTIAYNGLDSAINKYTHLEMARKFAWILDGLVNIKR